MTNYIIYLATELLQCYFSNMAFLQSCARQGIQILCAWFRLVRSLTSITICIYDIQTQSYAQVWLRHGVTRPTCSILAKKSDALEIYLQKNSTLYKTKRLQCRDYIYTDTTVRRPQHTLYLISKHDAAPRTHTALHYS